MESRVASVLLLFVVIAIGVAWYVDHRQLKNEVQQITADLSEVVQELRVSYTTTSARCHILAERHSQEFPGTLSQALKTNLLFDIFAIWKERKEINSVEENQAFNLVHDSLVLLKIDSDEKFIETFKRTYDDKDLWCELHDISHPSHESIKEFIRESLDEKYATKWGW